MHDTITTLVGTNYDLPRTTDSQQSHQLLENSTEHDADSDDGDDDDDGDEAVASTDAQQVLNSKPQSAQYLGENEDSQCHEGRTRTTM